MRQIVIYAAELHSAQVFPRLEPWDRQIEIQQSGEIIAAQVTTYFMAGAVFYPLPTKPCYEGPHPIFAVFLRT